MEAWFDSDHLAAANTRSVLTFLIAFTLFSLGWLGGLVWKTIQKERHEEEKGVRDARDLD